MKKLLVGLLAVGGLMAYCADIPVVKNSVTFTATGVVATTQLQGQSTVSVTNTGGSGNTVTVQGSNNNTLWGNLCTVTTGNTSTCSIGNTNTGVLYLRFNVTVYGSGTGTVAYAITPTVSGSGSGTSTVTCSGSGCTVLQGTTPWVVTTPGPIATLGPLASPSPLPSPGAPYTLPVTSFQYFWNGSAWVPVTSSAPLPVTTPNPPTPTGTLSGVINVSAGPTNITQVIAAQAGQNIYLYYASAVALGTNTAAFSQLYYGTTSSTPCDTGCTAIGPSQVQNGGSTGQQIPYLSASQFAAVITGFYPTGSGYKLPISQGVYVKSNGTLTNFQVFADFAQF